MVDILSILLGPTACVTGEWGEPTHETEPNFSLKSSSKRGAHHSSGARFVGRMNERQHATENKFYRQPDEIISQRLTYGKN
jgi:hypothetical protein